MFANDIRGPYSNDSFVFVLCVSLTHFGMFSSLREMDTAKYIVWEYGFETWRPVFGESLLCRALQHRIFVVSFFFALRILLYQNGTVSLLMLFGH